MLLKINAKKEVLFARLFVTFLPFLAFICFLVSGLINNQSDLILVSILFLILSVVFIFSILPAIQWFLIFEDQIVVKNIFGVVNSVNFSNVEYIEQKKLPLFTKDHEITHYIFVDGRPEKKHGFTQQSNTVNFKKTSVRVYVTPELTSIVEKLGLRII